MRDICGIDAARDVHEMTKHMSEELGYVFDQEEGRWSITSLNSIVRRYYIRE